MAKVTLWTRQDERFLEAMQKDGVFHTKREYIEEKNQELTPYFIKLYDWFVTEASKRVPRPDGALYPIWCSVNSEYMLRGAHGNILIKLSVDEDRIIYFDSPKWDLVINHYYIAKDYDDQKTFEKELKNRGITNSFALLDEHHRKFYPDLVQKVMSSWSRIFDVDKDSPNIFEVQANIWEIFPEDIVEIREGEKETIIRGSKWVELFQNLKPLKDES